MRLNGLRRRWRWLVTLVLLLLVGIVWFVMIHTPTEPAGRLVIERQENNNELFYEYDFLSKQLTSIPYNGTTSIDVGYQMSLSVDGKWATFVGVKGDTHRIFAADNMFTDVRPVSSGPRDFQPQLSPDGSQIVFIRSINYFSALFSVDVATGSERQLTQYTNDLEANWSPDGKRIVFTTSRDGFQELYTMAADGSDQKRLTNNERQNDLQGEFSPDGKWIAYMTNYSVGDGTGEIWLMSANGQNQRRLTNNQQDDRAPTWSPDSRQIAFTRTQVGDNGTDIFVYELADGQIQQLTNTGYTYLPVWSPDSAWIAFMSNPNVDGNQLYVGIMRADGTDQHLLLDGTDLIPARRGLIWTR